MNSSVQKCMLITILLSGINALNAAGIAVPALPKGIKNLTAGDNKKFIDSYKKTSTMLTQNNTPEGALARSNARQLNPDSLAEEIDQIVQEEPGQALEILGEKQAEIDYIKKKEGTAQLGLYLQRSFDMYRLPAAAPVMPPEALARAVREEDAKQSRALEEALEEIEELKAKLVKQEAHINQLEAIMKRISNEKKMLKKELDEALAKKAS